MKEIPLTRGLVALVDDADFDWLNQWKWHAVENINTFYVARQGRRRQGTYYMHRVLLGLTDPNINGDHRDGNGLNNQRYNLRIATPAQSVHNRGRNKNNTSGISGVDWYKRHGRYRWRVRVEANGKRRCLGFFDNLVDAAAARRAGEIQYHGEFSATLSRAA